MAAAARGFSISMMSAMLLSASALGGRNPCARDNYESIFNFTLTLYNYEFFHYIGDNPYPCRAYNDSQAVTNHSLLGEGKWAAPCSTLIAATQQRASGSR